MATKNTTFKLTEEQLYDLAKLSEQMGISKTAVIRRAVHELKLSRLDAHVFLSDFKRKFGEDAYLVVELDAKFDAFARIDGERKDDIYLPTGPIQFDGEDFVEVYLGDLGGRTRLLLGVLPLRAGVPLSVPVSELGVDMRPRAVVYFVDGK